MDPIHLPLPTFLSLLVALSHLPTPAGIAREPTHRPEKRSRPTAALHLSLHPSKSNLTVSPPSSAGNHMLWPLFTLCLHSRGTNNPGGVILTPPVPPPALLQPIHIRKHQHPIPRSTFYLDPPWPHPPEPQRDFPPSNTQPSHSGQQKPRNKMPTQQRLDHISEPRIIISPIPNAWMPAQSYHNSQVNVFPQEPSSPAAEVLDIPAYLKSQEQDLKTAFMTMIEVLREEASKPLKEV